jgi:hypothetical protein
MKPLTTQFSLLLIIVLGLFLTVPNRVHAEEIDIRQIPELQHVVQKIENLLPKPGNKGSARLESLIFDTDALEIRGTALTVAKHSWGRVRAPTLSNPNRKVEVQAQKTFRSTFIYNLETNRMRGNVNLGEVKLGTKVLGRDYSISFGEVKIDLERLQRALEGDLIAIVEMIPTPGVIENQRRNEYNNIRQSKWDQHGRENVYFASREFVNWATPERIGVWVVEAIVTGGAGSTAIMYEVSSEAMKEISALTRWLENKGIDEAQATAEQILSGRRVNWPFLAVYWQTIKYEARRAVAGNPIYPWIPVRHAAFYIVWKGTGSSTGNQASGGNTGGSVTIPNQTSQTCQNTRPTRLAPGGNAVLDSSTCNNVRSQPNTQAPIIGQIHPGQIIRIVAGPECNGDMVWWFMTDVQGLSGWTSEGSLSTYWLAPHRGAISPSTAQPSGPTDQGQLRSSLLTKSRSSVVAISYPHESTQFANALVYRLHEFQLPGEGITEQTMSRALSRADAGDRMNGIVQTVWTDWLSNLRSSQLDPYQTDPQSRGMSPFRQLIVRMIQGRQTSLIAV